MHSLRRSLPITGFLILLSVSVHASPDEVDIYRKSLGRVIARQRNYEAQELDQALLDASVIYREPFKQRGGPDAPNLISYDFSGYARVYERYADYEAEKGRLALALARVGSADVAEQLVETLLSILTDIQRQNQAIRSSRPKARNIHDQQPAIKRYGAWLHHDMVVEALGKLKRPEAADWLRKKGWAEAASWDRRMKSVLARVAILDAMGLSGREEERAFLIEVLEEKEPGLRIGALEALAALGQSPDTKNRLTLVREGDPCFAVREAARAVFEDSPRKTGESWFEFLGIPIVSHRLIAVLDASRGTLEPVDIELLRTRSLWEWRATGEKDRNWVSQVALMRDETAELVYALPEGAQFNLVLVNGPNRIQPLSPRGMLEASSRQKHRAEAFIEEIREEGWAPQIEGLWEACRIAGADPWELEIPDEPGADTMILVSNGVPSGGQILYGAAIVDDVRRRYRFNRIRIHTVRMDDNEAPAEELMKGIAAVTGGTYVYRTAP